MKKLYSKQPIKCWLIKRRNGFHQYVYFVRTDYWGSIRQQCFERKQPPLKVYRYLPNTHTIKRVYPRWRKPLVFKWKLK